MPVAMIGKSLRARFELTEIARDRAETFVTQALGPHAKALVLVRAQGPSMVACLVLRADRVVARTCRDLGLDIKEGHDGVFGLLGADVARLIPGLDKEQADWLVAPAGDRETKVLLLAGGLALVSVVAEGGTVRVQAIE